MQAVFKNLTAGTVSIASFLSKLAKLIGKKFSIKGLFAKVTQLFKKKEKKEPKTANKARLALILLWSLLPCPLIWLGLHVFKSATWAFALYHGVCLIPAIIVARKSWLPTFRKPTLKQIALLIVAAIGFNAVAVLAYELLGSLMLSNEHVLELLKTLGYSKELFWPMSFYAIIVNPFFEELFWRGVVLNELDKLETPFPHFGIIWSSFAYALFHYPIFKMVMYPGWAELGALLLAVYGAGLAIVYRKTGSIITTALTHSLLTDVAAILLILSLFRKFPGVL